MLIGSKIAVMSLRRRSAESTNGPTAVGVDLPSTRLAAVIRAGAEQAVTRTLRGSIKTPDEKEVAGEIAYNLRTYIEQIDRIVAGMGVDVDKVVFPRPADFEDIRTGIGGVIEEAKERFRSHGGEKAKAVNVIYPQVNAQLNELEALEYYAALDANNATDRREKRDTMVRTLTNVTDVIRRFFLFYAVKL